MARRLFGLGHTVTALGRNLQAGAALAQAGIKFSRADLSSREAILEACRGQDIVVHCGALSSPWGRQRDFHQANVLGTAHVIEGCESAQVNRLVHISTPSLYVDGRDRLDIREEEPLPPHSINTYARTKRLAEELIQAASHRGLQAIILRPQGIFGPGDRALLPRLIRMAERGSLPVLGRGDNVIDLTYIENVVDAVLLAMEAPSIQPGRCYNITNGSPVPLVETIQKVLGALNLDVPIRRIPQRRALLAARLIEAIWKLLPGYPEPPLTRYAVEVLSRTRTLSIDRAQRELGYVPRISMEDGLERFIAWWKQEHP